MMTDFKKATWAEMAETVHAIHTEMKRRNPIGINMYAPTVLRAAQLLNEIAGGEAGNFTSECGPKEPPIKKKREYKMHWCWNIGPFCGASLSASTTKHKDKVTCQSCRNQMKLHGHLEGK